MRVIVIECDRDLRSEVVTAFTERGHVVTPVDSPEEAVRWIEAGVVDLIVADIPSFAMDEGALMRGVNAQRHPVPVVVTAASSDEDGLESLKSVAADVLTRPWSDEAIDDAIEKAQAYHLLHGDTLKVLPFLTERIEFVIPSKVEYLDGILNHLTERLTRRRIIDPESIEVVVALDEAIVNAIKHGNGYDPEKRVKIVAEITKDEARFTIEDQGPGFSPKDVPDPCAPENLLRPSGRGLLLIRNIMDEVAYSSRGNVVTMVKRSASAGSRIDPNAGCQDGPGDSQQAS
jgi:serine/threonine-protein kinase RsbW